MRRLTVSRACLAVVVAVMGLVVVPGQATAGGPTSVLLVSPSSGNTASLYVTDHDYGELLRALGENPTADSNAPDVHGGPGTGAINVTWLVHDVSVWRIDRVFVNAAGGPWVETRSSFDGPAMDGPGVVYRAGDPALLLGLLEGLGLLGEGSASKARNDAAAPAAVERPEAAATPGPTDGRPGWWWLLAGLAAGALVGAGVRPAAGRLSRFRARERGYVH